MNNKQYLHSLKNYALFSLCVFLFASLVGYYIAQNYPNKIYQLIEELKSFFSSLKDSTSFDIFLFIFQNNVSKLFAILLLGIFAGLMPFFSVFSNGFILGVFTYIVSSEISWQYLFLGTIPHGIIEIPVLILSSAIGMKIGKLAVCKLFKKTRKSIVGEYKKALKFFVLVLIPLLFVAALIEAYITHFLLNYFFKIN